MIYYYGKEISPNQIETGEGFLICKNVPIARTGQMEYQARDLQLDGDPERTVVVNRYEEDVFEPGALASFEGKPVTDGHPPEEVNPYNFAAYSKGHVHKVWREGDFTMADLYINDPILMNDIQNGVKREVSCGYTCVYEQDGAGYKQTKIRGNHVAVVPRGRAGHEVSIKDESPLEGGSIMGKFTAELLKVFGTAAKDASNEDIEKMADTTAAVLDAAPAETAQEAEPTADVMVERAPKGDDLGSKLDRLIEMMESVMKKNDREEKKLSDEADIDELINRLSGGEKIESKEDSVTIPAEKMEDKENIAADVAALDILKKVRPAIASIEDRKERARVTDALLSAVKGDNKMAEILTATHDAARKSADTKKGYDEICSEQKSVYDSFNPHKNKEGK